MDTDFHKRHPRTIRILKKLGVFSFWVTLLACIGLMMVSSAAFLYLSPKLPSAETYQHVRLENPLRVYTSDNLLIAEFGDKKRDPVRYEDLPEDLVNALIASEDSRFYRHNGVDPRAIARSVVGILTGDDSSGGGSTLTMQVAKQISFAGEDPYSRKFKEILLAMQIERELSKQEIIELYMNLSFFGISAYGISAASYQYYDKPIQELTLAEMATMIGILPAPNSYDPNRAPHLAMQRRTRVLSRMLEQRMITREAYEQATNSPLTANRYGRISQVNAPYIAEMVRQEMVERYGETATSDGFEVYTTIDSHMQETANLAVKNGLEKFDHQHGYRGPENHIDPEAPDAMQKWMATLDQSAPVNGQQPAFVTAVQEQSFTALTRNGSTVQIEWDGMRWAKRFLNIDAWTSSPKTAGDVVEPGDLVRIYPNADGLWQLGQVPEVNAGMISIDPNNGQIRALVGGYDYYDGVAGKFNRVTQAQRQPGSNFKPFLYAAALANGYTAASLINDAPLARDDYRPTNFNGEFMGPIRLKYALTNSKNVVSVRLYDALGAETVLSFIERFGFDSTTFPTNDLTVAIGSHALTPLQVATGYAVFANGGYKVEPYLIERIENFNDGVIFEANMPRVCSDCVAETASAVTTSTETTSTETTAVPDTETPEQTSSAAGSSPETRRPVPTETAPGISRTDTLGNTPEPPVAAPRVLDERVAYIMNTILRSVITDGSGRPANRAMTRNDIAGKTGTTNDATDLWFSGFNGNLVTTVYVGFDQPSSLGRNEQAATVALPIWIDYMKEVLGDSPEKTMAQPNGLVTVRINEKTGLRSRPGEQGAIFEVFREEDVPSYDNETEDASDLDIFTSQPNPGNIF